MTRSAKRIDELLRHRPSAGLALEIAPYFNPAMPKTAGHNVLTVDIFDAPSLRQQALSDSNIPNERIGEIEEVDLVGDASDLSRLVKAAGITEPISFIVSSHNFEHLPNPIRFLRGVEEVLAPGGVLAMAIPDCRATFDYFRSLTRLSDWLVAYHDGHSQPSNETLFDLSSNRATFEVNGVLVGSRSLQTVRPELAYLAGDLRAAYGDWLRRRATPEAYLDSHVSVVFDASFRLMIEDLRHLGLIGLEIIEISENRGHEFFAHLRRPADPQLAGPTDYPARRQDLLRAVVAGIRATSGHSMKEIWSTGSKRALRHLFGATLYDRIRAWNKARRNGIPR